MKKTHLLFVLEEEMALTDKRTYEKCDKISEMISIHERPKDRNSVSVLFRF